MTRTYIGIGSNIGDRQAHIERALEHLAEIVTDTKRSSLFETSDRNIDIKTVDSLMVSHFNTYASQNNIKYKLGVPKPKSYEIISEGISRLKKVFSAVSGAIR